MKRRYLMLAGPTLLAVVAVLVVSGMSQAETAPPAAADVIAAGSASLHNPGFDNHDWYEFHLRYDRTYPKGAWLPDDDNNLNNNIPDSIRQDWRLWYLRGTDIVEPDPEGTYVLNVEAVQMRTYGEGKFLAGIYQPIYNTTPCLVYGFQIYAQSRPEGSNDTLTVLQVGIDRVGWHPDSSTDPAVHGSFPGTTVWGPGRQYQWSYGPLTVTAEAWNTKITVFTYADAAGGRSHRILWESASFWDATPPMIHDPNNLPTPSGISNLTVITASTTATITWTTASAALGQVYYRLVSAPAGPPPPDYPYKVYLPIVMRQTGWQYTPLNKTPTTSHQAVLTGLVPGGTYEFIAVARGLSGGQCVTWRSDTGQFTLAP
ncbi:MAG: hypothetical protein RML46_07235 [Anaerolineae bacterium]|nr:hypothetical protein [Anaerolineae bacterium]